jgi:LmbE family N-acetylglucosaminyl deacetylase
MKESQTTMKWTAAGTASKAATCSQGEKRRNFHKATKIILQEAATTCTG